MSQAAAITINDGLATPVARTFSPESVTPALSVFSERSAGIASLFKKLKLTNTFASGKSTVNRATFKVEYPVAQVVGGVTSVAYILRANLELILPDQCTDADRKDLYAYLKNGLAHASITGVLRDLDPQY